MIYREAMPQTQRHNEKMKRWKTKNDHHIKKELKTTFGHLISTFEKMSLV
jgi:hypothetical protein